MTWDQLFKANDVSLRDVKFSNIVYVNLLPFFAPKMGGAFALQKLLPFFSKSVSTQFYVFSKT